jgi:uncharacterized membrane protein
MMGAFEELKESFTRRRFAFFMYIVAAAVTALAFYRGYNSVMDFINIGPFEAAAAFFIASIYFFWIAGAVVWIGRNVRAEGRKASRTASIPLFGLAATLVIYYASELILNPEMSTFNFILSIAIGFVLTFVALAMEAKD